MSTISNISSSMNSSAMMQMRGQHKKPDASEMASNLFSALDTKGQGYIEKSDLQSAFSQISGTTSTSSTSSTASDTSVDELFSQLDSDSDGKITKEEMTSGLTKLSEELDSQFASMRQGGFQGMEGGGMSGMGGMPPPPPPEGEDSGFTQEELTAQLDEIGSTDSQRSEFISNIVNNFEAADTDGDGKVTFQEASAYNEDNSSGSTTASTSSSTSSTASSQTDEAKLMHQIMQLMHAYGGAGQNISQNAMSNLLSVSA